MPYKVRERPKQTFTKLLFWNPEIGKHSLRYLEPTESASVISFHYLRIGNGISVACLGDDCPICKANKQILAENVGKKWRDIPGLVSTQEKYSINVLDRTPVKICPNTECQAEVKADMINKFPVTCPKCSTVIQGVEVKPSNKVKVLSVSRTVAELISTLESSVLDEKGNPLPITSYDFDILVMPNGAKKSIVPQPAPERNDVVEVPEEAFYDTDKAIMELSAEEITNLLTGVSLSDIFSKRRAEQTTDEIKVDSDDVDISERVESLLPED